MANALGRETLLRNLAGNPTARQIAERALQIEDEATAKERSGEVKYPWAGFEWHEIPTHTQTLNQLVVDGLAGLAGLLWYLSYPWNWLGMSILIVATALKIIWSARLQRSVFKPVTLITLIGLVLGVVVGTLLFVLRG